MCAKKNPKLNALKDNIMMVRSASTVRLAASIAHHILIVYNVMKTTAGPKWACASLTALSVMIKTVSTVFMPISVHSAS